MRGDPPPIGATLLTSIGVLHLSTSCSKPKAGHLCEHQNVVRRFKKKKNEGRELGSCSSECQDGSKCRRVAEITGELEEGGYK